MHDMKLELAWPQILSTLNIVANCEYVISATDYQKKIDDYKRKIELAKSEVVADEELHSLQKELNEELQRGKSLQEELK